MKRSLIERVRARVSFSLARRGYLKSVKIGVADNSFTSPIVDGVFCTLSEPFMVDLLKVLLPMKPGAFLDVGVNLAQTLAAVKTLDKERRYVGFEPNPICVHYSEKLVAANQFTKCDIVPTGLGDQNGLIVLNHYSASRVDSSASMVPDFRPDQPVERRTIVPLCEYEKVEELGIVEDVGIIKIDVEGAELEVLSSIRELLRTVKPWVLIEVLPPYRSDNFPRITRQKEIEKILSEIGFEIFRVKKDARNSCIGLEWLSEFGVYDKVELSDFVFVPGSEKGLIEGVFD